MNSKRTIHRKLMAGVLTACVAAGVTLAWGQTQPAVVTPPASVTGGDQLGAIATVDGKQINSKAFDDILREVAGMRVFRQVVDLVLVQNACLGAGIKMEGDEFNKLMEAEKQRALDKLGEQGVPKEDREKVLNRILNERGVTAVEFSMGLQQAAGLRLLAKGQVKPPTQDEIQETFVAKYGPKVKLEVITVKSEADGAGVREELKKGGGDLRTLAASKQIPWQQLTISSNNTDGAPISDFRNAGFNILKPHELSATIPFKAPQGIVYYMVYLDEKIPDSGKKLPEVAKEVTQEVAEMKEQNWMSTHLNELRSRAVIEIKDPIIRHQYDVYMDAVRKAQEAAATQKATTMPGTVTPGEPVLPGVPGGGLAPGAGGANTPPMHK